jgi:hypothetical protein
MFFIVIDRSGFVRIARFRKFFFISVSPRFVAVTAMASGSIALVPFLWLCLSLLQAENESITPLPPSPLPVLEIGLVRRGPARFPPWTIQVRFELWALTYSGDIRKELEKTKKMRLI